MTTEYLGNSSSLVSIAAMDSQSPRVEGFREWARPLVGGVLLFIGGSDLGFVVSNVAKEYYMFQQDPSWGDQETPIALSDSPVGHEVEALYAREVGLSRFLNEISTGEGCLISSEMAERSWSFWLALLRTLPEFDLAVPDVMAGLEGELFLVWDNGINRFEANLLPDGTTDLIYLGHQVDTDWDSSYREGDSIPQTAIDKLRIFERDN